VQSEGVCKCLQVRIFGPNRRITGGQGDGKDHILTSFIIFNVHKILLG
jgi:hypothetical protein